MKNNGRLEKKNESSNGAKRNGLSKRSSVGPIKKSSAGPIKKSSAGPIKKSSAGPIKKSSAGPIKKRSTGPVKKSSALPERQLQGNREKEGSLDKRQPTRQSSERNFDKRSAAPKNSHQFLVWGKRPVGALLQKFIVDGDGGQDAAKRVLFLLADKAGKVPGQLKDLVAQAQTLGLTIKVCKGHEDETWPLGQDEDLQHQRIALAIARYPTVHIHDICQKIKQEGLQQLRGCIGILLDQVQDPRNFGAILRSAAFFGARFAIFGEDRQAPLSSTVLKASAGGAFSLDLCAVVNLNRAIDILKENGIWVVGSALTPEAIAPNKVPIDRPYVLVVGNEGKGMRAEITRRCDFVVKIPGGNFAVDSLNVSVAAGVLLGNLAGNVLGQEDTEQLGEDNS